MQPFKAFKLLLLVSVFAYTSCSKDKNDNTTDTASVTTKEVSNIRYRSAATGGVIESSNYSVIQRGVCWNTSPNPTLANSSTSNGTGLGTFQSNLNNLEANTTYYVRAYAVNEKGTSYGNELTFKTLDYPTSNIWKIDNQTFVANEITQSAWSSEQRTFGALSDNGLVAILFKQKPASNRTYKIVSFSKKATDLEDNECTVNVSIAKPLNMYISHALTNGNAQVEIINGKINLTIHSTNLYNANDSTGTTPIAFSAMLIEK